MHKYTCVHRIIILYFIYKKIDILYEFKYELNIYIAQ